MTRYLAAPVVDGRSAREVEVEVPGPLDRRRFETYRTIVANVDPWGYAPPIRVLAELLGLGFGTTVYRVQCLVASGHLERAGAATSHSYRVVGLPSSPVREARQEVPDASA